MLASSPGGFCKAAEGTPHMKVVESALGEVLLFEPAVHGDARGFFFESYRENEFRKAAATDRPFVQDSHSRSLRHVLRGLHYQIRQPQGKLVRAVLGEVFDVVVDLRRRSPTFGRWMGTTLSAENKRILWIPEGFAHGFLVTSDVAEVVYKATDYYAPQHERSLRWDDPALAIDWPLTAPPELSAKDAGGRLLADCDVFD
jgi:dTDP-4-dehydrorhamnose 3,5-epimerase